MIVPRLAVLAGATALAGCGANAVSGSETYTVAEVTQAFERGGLPVKELVEGAVPCDETFGPPEPDTEDHSCDVILIHLAGRVPGAILLPTDSPHEQPFSVSVYDDPAVLEDATEPLSTRHFETVVDGNVLVSVLADEADELLPQVEAILDDI